MYIYIRENSNKSSRIYFISHIVKRFACIYIYNFTNQLSTQYSRYQKKNKKNPGQEQEKKNISNHGPEEKEKMFFWGKKERKDPTSSYLLEKNQGGTKSVAKRKTKKPSANTAML